MFKLKGILPYIKTFSQPMINFIEIDPEVCSIFSEQEIEDSNPISLESPHNQIWHMQFYVATSREGNIVVITLYTALEKVHMFTFCLNFSNTQTM